jgi:hypothetical protein
LETAVNPERCRWLTLACLMLSSAHAGDIDKYSATLSVQGDSNDNRQWLGKVAAPLGKYAWAQASLGKSDLAAAGASDASIVGAALGVGGKGISAAVELVQRKGDARFEQQSWTATLDWHGMRGNVGADISMRSADAPSMNGTGFGLHGDFALTSRVIVFAGAMRYQYDFDVSTTSTDDDSSLLSFLFGTDAATPGAWRDQAFVDRTYRIGGTYLLERAAVSAQYFRDHVATTDETFSTVQLQAELPIAGQWLLSPTFGYSKGAGSQHVVYGGMNLRFSW